MTSPVWEFQGIPTKRPFLSWEFQLEFHRFQRREFPPREFQGPNYLHRRNLLNALRCTQCNFPTGCRDRTTRWDLVSKHARTRGRGQNTRGLPVARQFILRRMVGSSPSNCACGGRFGYKTSGLSKVPLHASIRSPIQKLYGSSIHEPFSEAPAKPVLERNELSGSNPLNRSGTLPCFITTLYIIF